jgi:hypothetical protein
VQIRRPWLVVALVAAVAAIPSAAIATHYFSDVSDDGPHAAGIGFVADWGITRGCDDARFCPTSPVTRQQMASFLYRSSGHHPDIGPVANALLINDAFYFEGFETLVLEGGGPHECAVAEPVGIALGLAIVTHQLVSSPGDSAISPAAINVAVDYDGVPEPDGYLVCFQTLDGSPLPTGEYETVFTFNALPSETASPASADEGPPMDTRSSVDLDALRAALEAKGGSRR